MSDFGRIRTIYERQADRAYRNALVILKDRYSAEDAVQNVFVTLIEKDIYFENDHHETAWIIRAVRNRCMDMLKSKWRRDVTLLDSSEEISDIGSGVTDSADDYSEKLIELLMDLPLVQREVLLLKYYEGFTVAEIAEIMGLKESAVRSAINSAKRRLKRGE